MGGRKRLKPKSPGKKARNVTHRATKQRRLDVDTKPRRARAGLDLLDDFAALRTIHSNGGNASALRQMEVFEWVGDAVVGELVARCMLSQFHHSPLSARVFRNLRLGVVTNQNLAAVFDLIGFQRHAIETRPRKTKEKADVVEAVVGEIVVRLELQKRDTRVCDQLRSHLDELTAAMLHEHFRERRRVHQRAVLSGPLTASFNAFDCLPQEHLDDETGELVVQAGLVDGQLHLDPNDIELQQKSFVDLVEECKHDDRPRVGSVSGAFHSFDGHSELHWSLFLATTDASLKRKVEAVVQDARLKLRLLNDDHILRSSREIFDVFKIYGMAVLAERVSLALAFPQLAFGNSRTAVDLQTVSSPSALTTRRQSILSMANLARCAGIIGLTGGPDEEDSLLTRRIRANTLRAFVGFYSAIAAENGVKSVADDFAFLLHLLSASEADAAVVPLISQTPRREPLNVLASAVNEAAAFMASRVCADLHDAGERPEPTPAPKFLLRQCDSETTENLFETLAQRSANAEHSANRQAAIRNGDIRSRKRRRSDSDSESKVSQTKPSANLVRFAHRRFLFCLEELIILFAQRKTEECRSKMSTYQADLEPCAGDAFRKWEVSTSTLVLAIPESFHRLLVHDLCHFHSLVSTSKTTRDGTRLTQLRLPLHYTWSRVQRRVTNEDEAVG